VSQAAATFGPAEVVVSRLLRRRRSERRWERHSFHAGIAIVVCLVGLALFHPFLGLPGPNEQDLAQTLSPPSFEHLFGTDDVGRDVFSRCLSGLALDLEVAISITALSLFIGVAAGALAGYFGGVTDSVIMRAADVVLAFPEMVFVIAIVAVVGPGVTGVYIAIPAVGWALYARVVRGEMLSLRERDFINAARTLGYGRARILMRHALPNVVRLAIVYSAIDVVLNVVVFATLSFLGLGVPPPTPELGAIINEGQPYVLTAWWITVFPGVVLVIIGIGFSLIGDGLAAKLGQDVQWGK
jgi:peptide/nickel transport system permease protein